MVSLLSSAGLDINALNYWHRTPLLCYLSGWQTPIDAVVVKKKYGSPANYVKMVEKRLKELEAEGWSLPVYHDVIMADARAVKF